ncbi:hypothetical protein HDU91_002539 [Kappamyces sp. JEL0680]|nr:hypothetical protein HDU91_002539 [Kappamyces sp. JEL0680]
MIAAPEDPATAPAPSKKEFLFNPIHNALLISSTQLLTLAPMYALSVTFLIEHTDPRFAVLSKNFEASSSTWGFQHPMPVQSRNSPPDVAFGEYVESLRKTWVQELQQEYEVAKSKETLKQAVALVGFVLQSSIPVSRELCGLAFSMVSCLVRSCNELYNDSRFKDSLREIQTMLIWTRPVDTELKINGKPYEGSLFSSIARLSQVFSRLILPTDMVAALKFIFMRTHTFKSSLMEIQPSLSKAFTLLLQVKDPSDIAASSRWFREVGDQKKRAILLKVGIKEYHKAHGSIESVLLANYIKTLVRSIQYGLIPDSIQSLLIWLVGEREALTKNEIDAVVAVLSLSKDRWDILHGLTQVCGRILREGTKDPITPTALASIVPVGDETAVLGTDQVAIRESMMRWHKTFGLILANAKVFDLE